MFILILSSCSSNKMSSLAELPRITKTEAQVKLKELSTGLEVYYDDMKGFTLCRCHYAIDENIVIVPYVLVYNDYSVSLCYHVLYSGREPLHFDTLYIKTPEGVKYFKYKDVSILYGHVAVEEYHGKMSNEVYETLKIAVNSGYAKLRLEGQQMSERELTRNELIGFDKVFSIYEYFNSVKVY